MAEAQSTGATGTAVPSGPKCEILIVLPGLLLALILAMLDQTVEVRRLDQRNAQRKQAVGAEVVAMM